MGDSAQALRTTHTIEDPAIRAWALSAIATAQAKTGDTAAAHRTLGRALESATTIENPDWRAAALSSVAQAQAAVGDVTAALETARAIEQSWQRAVALRGVAQAQVAAGDIIAALETTDIIEEPQIRVEVLRAIATRQAQVGDAVAARQTLLRALEAGKALKDPWMRTLAVKDVAIAQAEMEDIAHALETATTIGTHEERVKVLTAVAITAAKTSQLAQRQQLEEGQKQLTAATPTEQSQMAGGESTPPKPKPPTGNTWTSPMGMQFVLIPAGTFQMGSNDPDAYHDEKPVHQVTISKPFYLGTYEVTQGQWQAIMGTNPSYFKDNTQLPVEIVSWDEVQEFLRRLNVREGGTKYRLPTEAEWEYAARAGKPTAYSFGNDARQLGEYAWYGDNAGGKTHPIGQKKPNAWGLYDMHGNVWEWVQDWYGPYTAGAAVDPAGPPSGSHRVMRGGSWRSDAGYCQAANRYSFAAAPSYDRLVNLGFRLLREVP
jgi:formylglycine-generating enzyme required for sulfatase activity